MKCAYGKNCKCGGEVEKSIAIKISNKYYHEQCLVEKQAKKDIEDYYKENINPNEPVKNIRIAIGSFINKNGYDAEYVLFCLKYKAKKLNSIYGLSYPLSNKQNYEDYKKDKSKNVKIEFENNYETDDEVIQIKPSAIKRWGDFFG
jgi:hypothetical protein